MPPPLPTVTSTDDVGTSYTREVLCYDYIRDDTRLVFGAGVGAPINGLPVTGVAGAVVNVPAGVGVRTGMIFQYRTVVYVIERDITGTPANSCRTMKLPHHEASTP